MRTQDIPAGHDTITGAVREYAEHWGSKLVENNFLRWFALLELAGIVILAQLAASGWNRPPEVIYVRINDIGKAEVVPASEFSQAWHEPELKYFLGLWTHRYFERRRATVQEDLPSAMPLMETAAARAWRSTHQQEIEKLLKSTDDTLIDVRNIVLQNTAREPYRAEIIATKRLVDPRTREEHGRHDFIATVEFVKAQAKDISADMIPLNPIGIAITSVRKDEVFNNQ